jgi:hypothetical protein
MKEWMECIANTAEKLSEKCKMMNNKLATER